MFEFERTRWGRGEESFFCEKKSTWGIFWAGSGDDRTTVLHQKVNAVNHGDGGVESAASILLYHPTLSLRADSTCCCFYTTPLLSLSTERLSRSTAEPTHWLCVSLSPTDRKKNPIKSCFTLVKDTERSCCWILKQMSGAVKSWGTMAAINLCKFMNTMRLNKLMIRKRKMCVSVCVYVCVCPSLTWPLWVQLSLFMMHSCSMCVWAGSWGRTGVFSHIVDLSVEAPPDVPSYSGP